MIYLVVLYHLMYFCSIWILMVKWKMLNCIYLCSKTDPVATEDQLSSSPHFTLAHFCAIEKMNREIIVKHREFEKKQLMN